MPSTPRWTTREGKVPGEERQRKTSKRPARYSPGDKFHGNGVDLETVLKKKAAVSGGSRAQAAKSRAWGPPARGGGSSTIGAVTFDPASMGLEGDANIVWLEDPRRRYPKTKQGLENFAQTQAIIRERISALGLDYAVVRTGPHEVRNTHDEDGTVMKFTDAVTLKTSNAVVPDDLHITLLAGKKSGGRGEELYLNGHIYLKKVPRGDGANPDEFDYRYMEDPKARRFAGDAATPQSEEWWYTPGTERKSDSDAKRPVLKLAPRTKELPATGLEEATAKMQI